MEDHPVSVVRGYQPYPYGPRNERDIIRARKEVGPDGFITAGPETPEEWLHWNGAVACGWGGRYPIPIPGMSYKDGIFYAKKEDMS